MTPPLAPSVIQKLSVLGISDLDSLKSNGSVATFLLLKSAGFSVTYQVLYSLEATILGRNLSDLTDFERNHLRQIAAAHPRVRLAPPEDKIALFMTEAQSLADKAAQLNEVPVGCVIVKNDKIIGRGFNQPISIGDPTAHAEIVAMREAARLLANYRLDGCDLYVTLEPCAMCAGAIMQARISRLLFGAYAPKTGAVGSVINLLGETKLNKHTAIFSGINKDQCKKQIQDFFAAQRNKKQEL